MKAGVGLIGYGRFGKLAARYCARRALVHVYDVRVTVRSRRGIRRATLREAASQPVVILAVPISELRAVLASIRRLVRPGALLLDVCSVKSLPLRWMKRELPSTVGIVGMHPLFGPDSDTGTLTGQRVVVVPSRHGARWMPAIRALARAHRIRLHVMTPAAHDRLMAETLLLTQYIGRLIEEAGIPERKFSTASYAHLLLLVRSAVRDSQQLFVDMWRYNPYGPRTERGLLRAHRTLARKISG
jgi:prephenate dehydrogenase